MIRNVLFYIALVIGCASVISRAGAQEAADATVIPVSSNGNSFTAIGPYILTPSAEVQRRIGNFDLIDSRTNKPVTSLADIEDVGLRKKISKISEVLSVHSGWNMVVSGRYLITNELPLVDKTTGRTKVMIHIYDLNAEEVLFAKRSVIAYDGPAEMKAYRKRRASSVRPVDYSITHGMLVVALNEGGLVILSLESLKPVLRMSNLGEVRSVFLSPNRPTAWALTNDKDGPRIVEINPATKELVREIRLKGRVLNAVLVGTNIYVRMLVPSEDGDRAYVFVVDTTGAVEKMIPVRSPKGSEGKLLVRGEYLYSLDEHQYQRQISVMPRPTERTGLCTAFFK